MKVLMSIIWALTLGVVGFASGFFGPVFLNPGANQGPLLGIFFTGPISFIAGFVGGSLATKYKLNKFQNFFFLGFASIFIVFVVLAISLPGPRYIGLIIDGEIRSCLDPGELIPERIDFYIKSMEKIKQNQALARPGWKDDTKRMLEEEEGTVLVLHVYRKIKLYERQKPWNKEKIFTETLNKIESDEKYYARFRGKNCETYKVGQRQLFKAEYENVRGFPPKKLAAFLGLYVLEDMPVEFQTYVND